MPDDYTVDEVAAIKRVAPRTVRNWIRDGYLPAYRIGPALIRIKATDLEAMGRPIPNAQTVGR